MSYFATVSGAELADSEVDGLTLVPATAAQEYVRKFVPLIAAEDGEPVFFCDDTSSNTSDDFVGGAQDYAQDHGTLEGHAMMQLLALCERTGAVLRIWYADGGGAEFERLVRCDSTLDASRQMVERGHRGHWYYRIAP